MSPEVYSPKARSLGLQKSLAERLFDLYEKYEAEAPERNPNLNKESNVMWLTENYRCNEYILKFPSENFYGKKLIARGHESQPAHPKYGPLLFFSARGKDTKEQDNSYLNTSEVYEVEKRVKEIADSWPAVWGPKILSDIAVLSSYRYQVSDCILQEEILLMIGSYKSISRWTTSSFSTDIEGKIEKPCEVQLSNQLFNL